MQYFYAFMLALSLLARGSMAWAENTLNSEINSKTNKYPGEFVQSYTQECIQTSMTEGLEEIDAKKLCGCTIKEFQRQYSLEEFKQLTAASTTDKKAENSLIEVGQVCLEQILYE